MNFPNACDARRARGRTGAEKLRRMIGRQVEQRAWQTGDVRSRSAASELTCLRHVGRFTGVRFLPIKKRLASAAAVQEHVRKLALRPASYEPTGLGRGVEVTLKSVAGWPVYHTAPSASPDVGNHVLFRHGGGYINEIVRAHWRFIGYLTRNARVRCVVPIYPLAPRATAKDVVPVTGDLLRKLLEDAGPAKVAVVGNSAGAGLGLAGRALIVNAVDVEAQAFWGRRGFIPSKDDPLVLFRSIADIAASLR
jgi:acetyl esterase/lipase